MDKLTMLEKLINEGTELLNTISVMPRRAGVIYTANVKRKYRTNNPEQYNEWISKTKRFIKLYYPSEEFEINKLSSNGLNPENHKKIISNLKTILFFPDERDTKSDNSTNITINNEVNIKFINEILKNDLPKDQYQIIEKIIKEYSKDKDRKKIKQNLIEMGEGVLSNVLATLITSFTNL